MQGRPSYATIARKALSDERLDNAAGASPAAASSSPSRRREPRPADSRSTAIATFSRDGHATAPRRDISGLDVELDARSRARPSVSPRVVLPFVILTNGPPLQPPADVDDTRNVVASPIFEFFDSSASREARPAQREVLTSPGPISTSPMQLTEQLRPAISQPLSRDVLPSQVLRDTGSNIPLGPPELRERRERTNILFAR